MVAPVPAPLSVHEHGVPGQAPLTHAYGSLASMVLPHHFYSLEQRGQRVTKFRDIIYLKSEIRLKKCPELFLFL